MLQGDLQSHGRPYLRNLYARLEASVGLFFDRVRVRDRNGIMVTVRVRSVEKARDLSAV